MKYIAPSLFFATLLLSASAMAQPDAALDRSISSSGPMTAPVKGTAGTATYTYVRCYYRVSNDLRTPATRYEWARNSDGNGYYRLQGNWWAAGSLQWRNMFYTDTPRQQIDATCQSTLAARQIRQPLVMSAAADNAASFNHEIWQNDRPGAPLRRLIVLGDSLSDTNNMFNASQWHLPHPDSWFQGRFSNGPVWVEYLAHGLKLQMNNWAIGGAAVDTHLVVPGLNQEAASFVSYMKRAPDFDPASALFTVMIGGNDFVNYGKTVDQVIDGERRALDTLATAGARQILLLNLPDVSRAPVFRLGKDPKPVSAQIRDYNSRLPQLAQNLRDKFGPGMNVRIFDTWTLFGDMLDNPSRYDVDDTLHACLQIDKDASTTYLVRQTARTSCANPDRFVFWDTLHPTTHTHRMLAEAVQRFVETGFPAVR